MNDHPMNDDASDEPMNGPSDDDPVDERLVLLSSYLDDRVTDDERSLVEGDPRAMTDVARLRRVREATGRVEPPAADVRERALAAALAAADGVDRDHYPTDDPTEHPTEHPTVVPLLRRRIGQRVLAIAAVCAAVAALGVVAATVLDGSQDDASTSGDVAVERASDAEPTDESAENDAELRATGATEAAPFDDDAVAGDGGNGEQRSDADGAVEPPADDTGDDTADSDNGTGPGPDSAADATGTTHVGTVDDATLATVVQSLLGEPSAGTATTSCDDVVTPVVGTGDYQGDPVLLGPDPDRWLARAVDAGDCSVVAEVPLAPAG